MPYIKFYVRDWMMSIDLRRCSYAARGLWIEMMCLMSMDKYGYLEHNGEPINEAELESLTTGSSKADKGGVKPLLEELESHGVFSRDENGCIYSRRMVGDCEKRRMFEEYGKHGGNPKLMKRVQKEDKNKPRTQNPEPTHGLTQGVNPSLIPNSLSTPKFTEAWENWVQHRKEIKKPLTVKSVEMQMKEFVTWGPTGAVEAIEYTIKKGWQGIRRPESETNSKPSRKSYATDKTAIRDRAIAEIMERLKTERLATPEESFMEIAARLALSDKYKDIPGVVDKAVWTLNYEREA